MFCFASICIASKQVDKQVGKACMILHTYTYIPEVDTTKTRRVR